MGRERTEDAGAHGDDTSGVRGSLLRVALLGRVAMLDVASQRKVPEGELSWNYVHPTQYSATAPGKWNVAKQDLVPVGNAMSSQA